MLKNYRLTKPKVAHWQHFDRKNYSAFRSLGIVVAISVLSVSTLKSASAATAYDPTTSESLLIEPQYDDGGGGDTLDLAELEVLATMKSLAAGRTSRIITVISRQEIQESAALTIPDILKLASEVDVRQRGPFGVQTDISIDGGTFDQVTILLNGVNITSPQIGHYSGDWPVNIDEIIRVEVLDGAASRISGGSSLMGAINIVTQPRNRDSAHINVEGGQYATYGASAILSQASDIMRNQLSGAYRRSDGATTNSAFHRAQCFYHGSFTSEAADINWQAGYSNLDHGANTFYSAAYPNQHDALTRFIASVSADIKTPVRIEPMVYYHRLNDHYQLIHNTSTGENFHRNDVLGGRINASLPWAAGITTAGAEIRHERILSTNLGSPRDPVKCNDSVDYIYGDSRTALSLYLEHNVEIGRISLSGGFVAAMNTGLDHKFRFYPGIDASYTPARGWRIYASWSKAFRMPTFTDLYYKSVTHQGNKDLKPERMQSVQVGAIFSRHGFAAKVYGFYHRGHNMLDWVMYSPDDVFHSTGFDLKNIGFSLQGEVHFDRLLGNHQPLIDMSAGYTHISQHKYDSKEVFKSNYALEYLKHKLTLSLRHRIYKSLTATWALRWQERNGSYIEYVDNKATNILKPYKPYAVLDLKLQYHIRDVQIYVDALNLTDVRYHDFGNILQPGLWIMGGVSLDI